jgi:hypothetical protein
MALGISKCLLTFIAAEGQRCALSPVDRPRTHPVWAFRRDHGAIFSLRFGHRIGCVHSRRARRKLIPDAKSANQLQLGLT